MNAESLLFFRVSFIVMFFATLLIGGYLIKNHQRFFGTDGNLPQETSSERGYSSMMIYVVWLHMLLLFGGFALYLH
jgi:hypothetical protein